MVRSSFHSQLALQPLNRSCSPKEPLRSRNSRWALESTESPGVRRWPNLFRSPLPLGRRLRPGRPLAGGRPGDGSVFSQVDCCSCLHCAMKSDHLELHRPSSLTCARASSKCQRRAVTGRRPNTCPPSDATRVPTASPDRPAVRRGYAGKRWLALERAFGVVGERRRGSNGRPVARFAFAGLYNARPWLRLQVRK